MSHQTATRSHVSEVWPALTRLKHCLNSSAKIGSMSVVARFVLSLVRRSFVVRRGCSDD